MHSTNSTLDNAKGNWPLISNILLGHSNLKYSNFIDYLQASKSCRLLILDPHLWRTIKHDNYMPVNWQCMGV